MQKLAKIAKLDYNKDGPLEPWFDRTWKMRDIELIK